MHIWLVGLYGYHVFAKSQFFPTAKEYDFILLHCWLKNIENGKPHLNPN